jgi:hypothetical protein
MPSPTMIMFASSLVTISENSQPTTAPATTPAPRPSVALPVASAAMIPTNAPTRMYPSRAMSTTPER